MDQDGYPEEGELKRIEEWSGDFAGLLDFVRTIWWAPEFGWHQDGRKYFLSTGGWSGNESIIQALMENRAFWSLCWRRAVAGGHYKFRLPARDFYEDVRTFHKKMGLPVNTRPGIHEDTRVELRKRLIFEEAVQELFPAMDVGDLENIADGIADAIYVLVGTAIEYGIDIRPVWDEVHRSNMAKENGPRREDGKILKPTGWQPPDIKSILERQANGGANEHR